jgi:hypothetical protein
MNRDNLIDQLRNNVCKVEFTKVNGETRLMECTLKADVLPARPVAESDKPARKQSDENLSVWDVNAQGWRSFKIANVVSFGVEV